MFDVRKLSLTYNKQQEEKSLLLHGLCFVTGDPSVHIAYPYKIHPAVQISATSPGDSKCVYMLLPVPRGSLIKELEIAYHRKGFQSSITHIQLIEQQETISADVVYDDMIKDPLPTISTLKSACSVVVQNSMLLKICLKFTNTEDIIEFGSVVVNYIQGYQLTSKQKKVTGRHEYHNKLSNQEEKSVNRIGHFLRYLFFKPVIKNSLKPEL